MLDELTAFLKRFPILPLAIGLILALATLAVIQALTSVLLEVYDKVFDAEIMFWAPWDIELGFLVSALVTFLLVLGLTYMLIKAVNGSWFGTHPTQTSEDESL